MVMATNFCHPTTRSPRTMVDGATRHAPTLTTLCSLSGATAVLRSHEALLPAVDELDFVRR